MIIKEKLWKEVDVDYNRAKYLAEEIGVSPLVTSVLWGRGFRTADAMRDFLFGKEQPFYDPMLMLDMDKACLRIEQALHRGEKITVYGDYDVDGITATSVLVNYLQGRGANVGSYIPKRQSEGYGLNDEALKIIRQNGTTLVITVDCGISGVDTVANAPEGLDIIVTDHHTVPEQLPEAVAVIDPHRPDCGYPFKDLCGVGVAFKVCQALEQRQGRRWTESLDLVAFGTVADIVPLVDENREIVRLGLKKILVSQSVGIQELVKRIVPQDRKVNTENIAFMLAPRLNAVGRLGDAKMAVELLTTGSGERAAEIVDLLDHENAERQQIGKKIVEEADAMLEGMQHIDTAIILKSDHWHQGVIGIVASRMVEKYQLPALLFSETEGVCKGSCRSVQGLNIFDALTAVSDLLIQYGGHSQAAGLTLKSENFEEFVKKFRQYVQGKMKPADFNQQLMVDMVLPVDREITLKDLKDLALIEPCGSGNPAPVFAYRQARLQNCRLIGARRNHLAFDVVKNFSQYRGVMWSREDMIHLLDRQSVVADIAFQPRRNEWDGEEFVQLHAISLNQWPAVYDLRALRVNKLVVLARILKTESAVSVYVNSDKEAFRRVLTEKFGANSRFIEVRHYDEVAEEGNRVAVFYDLPQVDVVGLTHVLRQNRIPLLVLAYGTDDWLRFRSEHPGQSAVLDICEKNLRLPRFEILKQH